MSYFARLLRLAIKAKSYNLPIFQINCMLATIWGLSTLFALLPLTGINRYISEVRSPLVLLGSFALSARIVEVATLSLYLDVGGQSGTFLEH